MTTAAKTSGSFLCHVGTLAMHRSNDGTAYDLFTSQGERVGTYPTAKSATNAGIARIAAAYRAR